MKAVFLVPRRRDGGHRDELWRWCRARWEALMPDVPVIEGHHDEGPFNRSAAINAASRIADANGRWDVAIVIDSDVFLSIAHVRAAIDSAAGGKVTWAHRRWRGISEGDTRRLIADPDEFGPEPATARDMDLIIEKTTPISWSCCVAIPRATFDDCGGFDERFRGWGFEDGAWSALIRATYPWARIEGDIYHWFHPRSDERIDVGRGIRSASRDYIRNGLLGRRYMIAAIRDHHSGDQPGEEKLPAKMAAIHVANLTTDDRKFLDAARDAGMPEANWDKWWPNLEELRDGARAAADASAIAARSVSVIITSGGPPASWPIRAGYLRRSLTSFAAHVRGPIAQRVIFSDWGAEHTAELEKLAGEFGFYVVGGGNHGYTAMRQRLWSYIGRKAHGRYVFAAEDDFLYDRDVDLAELVEVLDAKPEVSQVALLRQPAYQSEIDRGGILGWPTETFKPHGTNGSRWLEHRNFWTANPSLFRPSLTAMPWPSGESSERLFADALFSDPKVVAAFWGDGQAQITHVGAQRAGSGY